MRASTPTPIPAQMAVDSTTPPTRAAGQDPLGSSPGQSAMPEPMRPRARPIAPPMMAPFFSESRRFVGGGRGRRRRCGILQPGQDGLVARALRRRPQRAAVLRGFRRDARRAHEAGGHRGHEHDSPEGHRLDPMAAAAASLFTTRWAVLRTTVGLAPSVVSRCHLGRRDSSDGYNHAVALRGRPHTEEPDGQGGTDPAD